MINYGTGGKKIQKKVLKKYWEYLTLDPYKLVFFDIFYEAFDLNQRTEAVSQISG